MRSPGDKVRLDVLLVERGLAETRQKAQALLLAGQVEAEGVSKLKAGTLVQPDQALGVKQSFPYVSRGASKLEGALKDFQVDPQGRVCLDVGASTGGFTDCLLQKGAARVVAVDVGRQQLHEKLRRDERVISYEKTHVLSLRPDHLKDKAPSLVTVDVSFISLSKVLPHLLTLVDEGTEFITLVKPQFEGGPRQAPKGVVRDPAVREKLVQDVAGQLPFWGCEKLGEMVSPLKGPKGNVEYFLHFKKISEPPLQVNHAD